MVYASDDLPGLKYRWIFLKRLLRILFHRILALYSHVCLSVCPQAWHFHLSPPYDVLDHTNHIFSESLSSGDDIGRDEDLQKDKYKDKDTQTQTKTNTKCFQDPIYAIFFISRGFKDLKYYIGCLLVMTQTKTAVFNVHHENDKQGHFRTIQYCIPIEFLCHNTII